MSETSSDANQPPAKTPIRFLLRYGILIREVHGLPSADFEASKSNALRLFQNIRTALAEDAATKALSQDRAGALALLSAIILESNIRGDPLSLPAIADAKREDSEWVTHGFQNPLVWLFFRNAIQNMPISSGKSSAEI